MIGHLMCVYVCKSVCVCVCKRLVAHCEASVVGGA